LKAHGLCCIEAKDGEEALNALSIVQCDLILTDLRMPNINGLQLIQTIREREKIDKVSKNKPIVVLSAEEGEMLDEAIALGVSGYFIKSKPIDILVPKLKQLLGETAWNP